MNAGWTPEGGSGGAERRTGGGLTRSTGDGGGRSAPLAVLEDAAQPAHRLAPAPPVVVLRERDRLHEAIRRQLRRGLHAESHARPARLVVDLDDDDPPRPVELPHAPAREDPPARLHVGEREVGPAVAVELAVDAEARTRALAHALLAGQVPVHEEVVGELRPARDVRQIGEQLGARDVDVGLVLDGVHAARKSTGKRPGDPPPAASYDLRPRIDARAASGTPPACTLTVAPDSPPRTRSERSGGSRRSGRHSSQTRCPRL